MMLRITYEISGKALPVGVDDPRYAIEVPLKCNPTTNVVSADASLEALQDFVALANSGKMEKILLQLIE